MTLHTGAHTIPYSRKFSGGNIFVDFNNQSYSWGKIFVVSESIIANHS